MVDLSGYIFSWDMQVKAEKLLIGRVRKGAGEAGGGINYTDGKLNIVRDIYIYSSKSSSLGPLLQRKVLLPPSSTAFR